MNLDSLDSQLSVSADEVDSLLVRARNGHADSLGQLLEATRAYLRFVADRSLEPDVYAKVSGSDLVQDTFLAAHNGFGDFRGTTREELLAWLRRILVNRLINCYRDYRHTDKRRVSREEHYDSQFAGQHAQADPETPSQAAAHREEAALLDKALERLDPDHRRVIQLRHREGLAFADIGREMNRSPDAARMLWYRAFNCLTDLLKPQ